MGTGLAEHLIRAAVVMGTSQYGHNEPRLNLRWMGAPHWRADKAALLRIAAEVEDASRSDRWVVNVGELSSAGGSVSEGTIWLELAEDTAAEAERGRVVLQGVTDRLRRLQRASAVHRSRVKPA